MIVKIRDFIRKYKQLAFFIGLLIVGTIFAIVGLISLSKPKVDGVKVNAKIVNITREELGTNADGYTEFSYTVYVEYTDNEGKIHTNVEYNKHDNEMVVGDTIEVMYDPSNPGVLVYNDRITDIIFIVIGISASVLSIIKIISVIKTKNINEFNRVDMKSVSNETIEKIKNSNEEENEYYFHFTGTNSQSYIMETIEERKPIYEAKCDKIGIVSKNKFTFINHLTGKQEEHTVSHVVTSSYDSFVTSSNFKVDDINVWDILGKAGYSLDPHFNGVKSYFDIFKYGVKVAKIELAGTNAYKDGKNKILGALPIKGMFKVYCKNEDIEMVFLSAFILSKVDLF